MLLGLLRCAVLDTCVAKCLCSVFTERESHTPAAASGRTLTRARYARHGIAVEHMSRLVAFGDYSDLELTLRTYKVLSRADVGAGKLDTDIGRDIVRTADGVNLRILSSEVVDLILENSLDIIRGLL